MNQIQPKTQKRYESEQEIIDAIDTAKVQVAQLEVQAAEFDRLKSEAAANSAKADEDLQPGPAEFWKDQMHEFKKKAEKLRKRVNSINGSKLISLKERLAEFRTEPMNFMGGDNSIVR